MLLSRYKFFFSSFLINYWSIDFTNCFFNFAKTSLAQFILDCYIAIIKCLPFFSRCITRFTFFTSCIPQIKIDYSWNSSLILISIFLIRFGFFQFFILFIFIFFFNRNCRCLDCRWHNEWICIITKLHVCHFLLKEFSIKVVKKVFHSFFNIVFKIYL